MLSGSLGDKKIFYPFLLVDSFSRHWWIRIERECVSVLDFSSTDSEKIEIYQLIIFSYGSLADYVTQLQ